MANTKSALKAMRVSEKRRMINKTHRSKMRTYIRRAESVLHGGSPDETTETIESTIRVIDRTASKGIIHRNQAARRKSRLMKKLNQLKAGQA